MTSVLNHQLLLSGNKGFLFIFIISAFLMSCASGKSAASTRNPKVIKPNKENPVAVNKPTTNKPSEPIDTINWSYIPDENAKPIHSLEESKNAVLARIEKSTYKVALLMPFRATSGTPDLDANNLKFAQFYGGLKLAAQERDIDVVIQLHTYSSNREGDNMTTILDELAYDLPDVIIGPYETELLQKVAEFAKEHRITAVSPWKSSTKITENNPYYLQLRPNITDYYESIVKHVNQHFDRSKVCIIGRSDGQDATKSKVIQKINQDITALPLVQPYQEYLISMDTLLQADSTVFASKLEEGIEAFIIPHYVARDEAFLYSTLRKLYGERSDHEFYVYTMPLALTSEQVDLNILKNLNIRGCEFKFVDNRNVNIQTIREDFYNAYGWLPDEDAYYGYDVMQFVKKGLASEGQYFHYYMQNKTYDFDQMAIRIAPKLNADGDIDYLVNSHMYIIEYDRDHFKATSISE